VDDRCGTDSSLGVSVGEQLHHGGFIHILLVIALIVIVVGFIQGRGML